MQVQAINNNQPSFGAIYQPKNINFNKVQEPIFEAIKKAMREPLQKFKGKTAEGFYESKGLDFEIAPYKSTSVSLTAYKGIKEIGTGVDRRYTYLDRLYIGEYDHNSGFKVSDIEARLKEKKGEDSGFFAVALFGVVAVLALTLRLSTPSERKIQETTKPLIENVDSVVNKAKAVLPDSVKVLKTIKK